MRDIYDEVQGQRLRLLKLHVFVSSNSDFGIKTEWLIASGVFNGHMTLMFTQVFTVDTAILLEFEAQLVQSLNFRDSVMSVYCKAAGVWGEVHRS